MRRGVWAGRRRVKCVENVARSGLLTVEEEEERMFATRSPWTRSWLARAAGDPSHFRPFLRPPSVTEPVTRDLVITDHAACRRPLHYARPTRSAMVYINSWQQFQDAAESLYTTSPTKVRNHFTSIVADLHTC